MEISDFDSYREDNRLEAKLAKGGLPKSVWESYSAFANSAGGVILLGVEELQPTGALAVAGVDDPDALVSDFWNTVNNPQKVSSNILTDGNVTVAEIQGKAVVRINVPRANRRQKPVFLNDNPKRCFHRNHSGGYLCRYEEVRSMIRDASEQSPDAKPLPEVHMGELNVSTVSSYRRRYARGHDRHPWNRLDDNEFLRVIGAAAIAEDEQLHPTGAGLLLFGSDWRITEIYPHYFLDYRQQISPLARWQDRVTSSSGDWTGNVYDFYFRVYNLMKQALRPPFQIEGISRVDDTAAHRALREALANCLTNANYHERRGVVCIWEEDALRISNPGDFRIDLSSALLGGKSDPRNENMLRMFSYVDIGERAGSGLPKIMEGWTACGYPTPFYEEECGPDRVTLTLPLLASSQPTASLSSDSDKRRNRTKKSDESKSAAPGKAERTKAAIVTFLEKNEKSSRADIVSAIGLSPSRASELLGELVSEGKLAAEGSTRNRTYRAASQSDENASPSDEVGRGCTGRR